MLTPVYFDRALTPRFVASAMRIKDIVRSILNTRGFSTPNNLQKMPRLNAVSQVRHENTLIHLPHIFFYIVWISAIAQGRPYLDCPYLKPLSLCLPSVVFYLLSYPCFVLRLMDDVYGLTVGPVCFLC
jgi:hypothetical protein